MLSFFLGLVINQVIRVMMDLTYTCSICFPPAVTVCPIVKGFHRYLRRLLLRFSCAGPLDSARVQLSLEFWDGCEEPRTAIVDWSVLRTV